MNLKQIKERFDLSYIEENPVTFAEESEIKDIVDFIIVANKYYYNTSKSIVTDYAYDEIKDVLIRRDPNNSVLDEVGAPIDGTKNKVDLPYWMGSMTKVKPGDKKLNRFIKKYNGPYVLSDKLDGISGLITYNHNKKPISIYSRGGGNVGGNLDYIIPYIKLPKHKFKIAVRGEFVVKRSTYVSAKHDYKNPRSFVAGVINHKHPNITHLKMIDFVAYELIYPWDNKSSYQLSSLEELGFNVVHHKSSTSLTEKNLEKYYQDRLDKSDYDIDGLIITDDKSHQRNTSGNPDYSRAFKLDLRKYETKVLDVIWNPSKDGLLKPVVLYESVKIGGNTHVKATCNNARYVIDNKIGKGAIINIIRTNDVLPKVVGVIKPAKIMILPPYDYNWNSSKVEFVLVDKNQNETVIIKRMVRFFTTLKIENINEGLVNKLYQNGYTTIADILEMEIDDFMELEGFKDRLAKKIYDNIHNVIDKPVPLDKLMTASNAFQNGFAEKKLKSILLVFPNLLENRPDIEDIVQIDGWDYKTAKRFLDRLPDFILFLKKVPYVQYYISLPSKSKSLPLNGVTVVFSNYRDKNMESLVESLGGKVTTSVSKNTTVVVTTEPNKTTGKIAKARDLGVSVLTPTQFETQYSLNEY